MSDGDGRLKWPYLRSCFLKGGCIILDQELFSINIKQIALHNNPLLGGACLSGRQVPGWVISLDAPLKCPYNYEKDACDISNNVTPNI
jgi:hypothetical protein